MPNDATNPRANSQFEPLTFDASAAPGEASCKLCGTALRGSYHLVNDSIACAQCRFAAEAKVEGGTSAAGLMRAVAFGVGAAIAGAAGYYAFTKATGIEWALLTGLVGLGVGKAVNIGGNGHGGRKFQIVALVLTWLAMGAAYLPFMVEGTGRGMSALSLGVLFVAPVIVAVASPISGLFIAYALYRAWKFNRGGQAMTVSGPFRLQSAPNAPPAP